MSDGDMVEAVARELEAELSNAERENRTFACGYNLIRAAIKALRSPAIEGREGWQPIATAPKDGRRVMLWAEQWTDPASGIWANAWTVGYDLPPFLYEPTHWRPLPSPPIRNGEG